MLSLLIFLPLIAILPMALMPNRWHNAFRWLALAVSLVQVALTLVLAGGLPGHPVYVRLPWISLSLGEVGTLGIHYELYMDGTAWVLTLLTTVVNAIAIGASWNISHNIKGYFMLFMLLSSSLTGVFLAADFFLFFIFYEFMLLPMFFLIGLWGGPRREYASIKFFIYTLAGSVFMLLVMAGLALSTHAPDGEIHQLSLSFRHLADGASLIPGSVFDTTAMLAGMDARTLAFVVLLVAFLIKLPAVPLHTWLPDAHVEAPTPVSVVLAGVLLKVGGYGIWRICFGFFPDVASDLSWHIGLIGVVSIVYGALVAMGQTDLKRMIAYSSVSHMGYVLLGLASHTSIGTQGALYQLFTHGLVSPMLFLIAGVVYDRVHDRTIANFGGLWSAMPRYGVYVVIAFFASLGLPGLCAFISEVMIFMGAFQAPVTTQNLPLWMAFVAVSGVILSAVYYLRAFRQMFFGPFRAGSTPEWDAALHRDLSLREHLLLLPLAIGVVVLGIFPMLILYLLQ